MRAHEREAKAKAHAYSQTCMHLHAHTHTRGTLLADGMAEGKKGIVKCTHANHETNLALSSARPPLLLPPSLVMLMLQHDVRSLCSKSRALISLSLFLHLFSPSSSSQFSVSQDHENVFLRPSS